MKSTAKFWGNVISSTDPTSSKRLVTLVMAAHFIITSFLATFFIFYLIIYTPKGSVNKDLLELLKQVLEQDFYVILAGLGFIAADGLALIILEKAKAKIAGDIAVNTPSANTVSVVKQNIPTTEAPIEPEPPK